MTATLERRTASVGVVVRAAVDAYTRRHEPVVESWLAEMAGASLTDALGFLPCVTAIDRRIVEIILPPDAELAGLTAAVLRLDESGWRVLIVAPAPRMGDVHNALRGAPATLQPWWVDNGDVAFGAFEQT
jgi:hypothetical protein